MVTLLLLVRATYMNGVLFFTHIPFVVNHTINATPPERLQQHQNNSIRKACSRWKTGRHAVDHLWSIINNLWAICTYMMLQQNLLTNEGLH